MESECGLPPLQSIEEGSHSDSDTPLRPAPTCVGPAVHHQDPQEASMQLVSRLPSHRAARVGSICPQGSGEGNTLPQSPVLDVGPDGDDEPLPTTGAQEGFNDCNDDLRRGDHYKEEPRPSCHNQAMNMVSIFVLLLRMRALKRRNHQINHLASWRRRTRRRGESPGLSTNSAPALGQQPR